MLALAVSKSECEGREQGLARFEIPCCLFLRRISALCSAGVVDTDQSHL